MALIDRELEWGALDRWLTRRHRLAVVYGPRRAGKSFLLQHFTEAVGGRRHQAVTGTSVAQLDDFGRALGEWFGSGPLRLDGWADALERIGRLDAPVVVIDELPYLTEAAPELVGMLQRHVDAGVGPSLVFCGSSLSTMAELVAPRAPLFGRAEAVVVPTPFQGPVLGELWGVTDPRRLLWIDAALGGLPGYRPLLDRPGRDLDRWMVEEVLAPSSPILDAAEAALVDLSGVSNRGLYRSVLAAIAAGNRSFANIARVAGVAATALTRPIAALERAGLVVRIADPVRSRRDGYDLADPHLRFWLAVVSPHRASLQAGRAAAVWERLRETTWPSQVLGPRWERVVRDRLVALLPEVDAVGATVVSDPSSRSSHEVDLVAVRNGAVVAVGEAKLRRLGRSDLARLERVRALLHAPEAEFVLASATGFESGLAGPGVRLIGLAEVYGNR